MFASYCGVHWFLQGYNGSDVNFERNPEKAVLMLETLRIAGYAPGQYHLSVLYLNGELVNKNWELGTKYLMLSAEQNYLPAKALLANCYLTGQYGIPQDMEKGMKMAEECANAGDVNSQYAIGYCYCMDGDKQDYQKAFHYLSLAANNGNWQAMNALAYLYAKGKGTSTNFVKAHQLIKDAKFKAQNAGELSQDVEANLLDTDGELYLMEGKTYEANLVWKQMKTKFPNYIEQYKYVVENVFVRTMYEQEAKANQTTLASNDSNKPQTKVVVSDIDEKIPENAVIGSPTFAVIIANENYKEVEAVPFAIHDGETFKQYCEKTLGIPQSNIKFVADATLNNIKRQLSWLNQVMDVYQGEANIIFYYAGHGIPDEANRSAYLLPVDGFGSDVSTGYSLDKLYEDLGSKPAKSVVVLLDACFSGAKRDGGMLASARGVAIKAKQNAPKGNMVVISAAQGDETAYPYKEKGHGMFTYYLLKKLQETKGKVTYGELADYVTTEVKKQSIVINGKTQTPTATAAGDAAEWKFWKLR